MKTHEETGNKKREQLTKEFLRKFQIEERYFFDDKRTFVVFTALPENKNLKEIRIKVNCINEIEIREVESLLVNHIKCLGIDPMLRSRDPGVVDLIAGLTRHHKRIYLYQFASKYCNFHFPDDYPIYSDQTVQIMVDMFPTAATWNKSQKEKLDYSSFKVFVEKFRSYFQLEELNYFELDRFVWIHGRDLLSAIRSEKEGKANEAAFNEDSPLVT